MQTRYENLLDQLHTNKRQLANYRQRYLSIQNQLLTLQQENRTHKKNINSLRQNNEKLSEQNKALLTQKQSILSEYSTSVESIKQQITKKQNQIYLLKENSFSPLANQKLLEKQLRCELESHYEEQLQSKQKRIRQLLQQIDKSNFQKAVEKQKYQLKLESLQKQLKQMQNSHLIELQNYANRTYQNSQSNKISQEQSLIKKLRRQIDQLRLTLDSTQQQLHESIAEKTKIQKQHSTFISKHKSQVQKYAEEIRALQFDSERFNQPNSRNKTDREKTLLKQKQKQIKSLKDKIQQLHEKLNKKDAKLSEIEVQMVTKSNEIKKLKQFNSKHQNEKISELKIEKQSYRRQINELKHVNENIRKQNIELMGSISQMNIKSVKNIKEHQSAISRQIRQSFQAVQKQQNQQAHRVKPSIVDEYEENHEDQFVENSFANLQRAKSSTNLREQNFTKLELFKRQYEDECYRNKQLSTKYVELKKKYKILGDKFNQANSKLIELLKDKIQLGSPTAASKKSFQFPTSPPQKYFLSPDPLDNRNTHESQEQIHYSKTQGNLNPLRREIQYSSDMTVSKAKRGQRSESKSKGDQSFYQKSLKIKNSHKFKQIKCLNHDDPQQDHTGCSHSPLK